ncbi:Uncharacterized protein FKW44_017838 [Caligus rogercresseyi]|uniref:Vitellogenin domain-containing protein n=1 Tax=Caligus rogercresseyi TaxID=217165 RepID=A0A7T8GU00_CALRO|nr:Uncharacterized protein FKW44_017838 [Caligus rogercresseyi]
MDKAPSFFNPISTPHAELVRNIQEMMSKIVRETYEVPETCSSSTDLAGTIFSIAGEMCALDLAQMKELDTEVQRFMEVRHKEAILTSQYLFYDILAMIGTNPSISYIKTLIESDKIPRQYAPDIIESALKSTRTPTPELFNLVFTMIKSLKTKSPQLFAVSAVTFSDLLHRACVNPSSMVAQFPVHVYGNFCSPETPFIEDQYIPYLESQIQGGGPGAKSDKIVVINALGKTGHYRAVDSLVKVIEGTPASETMVRSLAVYALKRAAVQYPSKVKPILMSIINNPGMDYVFDQVMNKLGLKETASPEVSAELKKIEQKLQIKPRVMPEPELSMKVKFMGLERIFSLDSKFYMETIQKVAEKLRSSPKSCLTDFPSNTPRPELH